MFWNPIRSKTSAITPSPSSREWNAATQVTTVVPAAAETAADAARMEEEEVLHASIKAGSVAQIVLAVIAVVGLIYLLKVVLVTILVSMLLAFALEPLVKLLCRIRIPRAVGSLLAVLLLVALASSLTTFSTAQPSTSPPSCLTTRAGSVRHSRGFGHKPAKSNRARDRSLPLRRRRRNRSRSKSSSRPGCHELFRRAVGLWATSFSLSALCLFSCISC